MKNQNALFPKTHNGNGVIRAGDCREGMAHLPDSCVDLVLTDPPYFIEGMGADWSHEGLQKQRDKNKTGCVGNLPGGMKFDADQGRRLQRFMQPVATAWMRLIKPGGFVLCFSQNRLSHRMACAIEDAGFEVRDLFAWRYEGQCKAFKQDHFVKKSGLSEREKARRIKQLQGRKTPQLKPQMEAVIMAQAPRNGTYVENWLEHGVGLVDMSSNLLEPGRCPGTVMPAQKPKVRYGHMTVKPVDLLRHMIRLFTKPGALVLDPFAGSGSTGVAACVEGRQFVGFEMDSAMAAIANQRLREAA